MGLKVIHQFLRTVPVVGLNAEGFEEMAEAVSIIARAMEIRSDAIEGAQSQ